MVQKHDLEFAGIGFESMADAERWFDGADRDELEAAARALGIDVDADDEEFGAMKLSDAVGKEFSKWAHRPRNSARS